MDLWSTWNLLLFIIGFGSLIFVHELGHFLVAKWVGIKATTFAIGFGQAILCYRRGIGYRVGTTEPEYQRRIEEFVRERRPKVDGEEDTSEIKAQEIEDAERELGLGETEYRLNWIPFGGYVKMVGQEDLDPKALSDNPRAFNKKPIWARMCVISAGVVMNVIFAVLFFMVAFMIGVQFPPAIVGGVAPDSPAANAEATDNPEIVGLQPGDRVEAINGEATTDFLDVRIASALAPRGRVLNLDVERPALDGSAQKLNFAIVPVEDSEEKLLHIGVTPAADTRLAQGPGVAAQLESMGLEPGMRLVAVNGQPIQEHWQFRRLLEAAEGQPVEGTFETVPARGQEPEQRTVTLEPQTDYMISDDGEMHLLGLKPATRINGVQEGAPADGELQSGDIIVALENASWPSPTRMSEVIGGHAAGEPVAISVLRDGVVEEFEITPRRGLLGIGMDFDESVIRDVASNTPFASLDLPAGTRLLEVDGEPAQTLSELRVAIQSAPADQENFEITYQLPVGDVVETQELTLSEADRTALAQLDWLDGLPFTVLQVTQQTSNPIAAIGLGVEKTHSFMMQTYITISRLFGGTVRVEHLRGPVGIVETGTQFSDRGFAYLLFFLGLISINLAVINFLPLPIVDGGLALLLLWEKVRGKPAPPEVQSVLTVIGLLLIGALFVTVTYHDIARLVTGG
ncbi:MAG: site-2 protease family protein [Phycisphaeraceae bacterium]